MIDVNYGPLKEIHQSDLKPFPKLKCLELFHNEIETLEEGLFDFNTELEMIWLSSNKIFHIDPEIFNHLIGKLRYLSLDANECISDFATNDTKKVAEIVENISKKCVNSKIYGDKIFTKIEEKIENLEIEQENLKKNEVWMAIFGIFLILGFFVIVLATVLWKLWKKPKSPSMAFENLKFEDNSFGL
jgi:Leucine-rich repeat (LRR) protein